MHIPAFLVLSGYLIRAQRLRERTYPALVVHYLRRMLLPWRAVSLVRGWTFGTFDERRPLRSLLLGAAAAVGLLVCGTPLRTDLVPHTPDGLGDHRYYAYLVWCVLGRAVRNSWPTVPGASVRGGLVAVGAVTDPG